MSEEIDYEYLCRQFKIAGGNISNIVLNSAFLAAENRRYHLYGAYSARRPAGV